MYIQGKRIGKNLVETLLGNYGRVFRKLEVAKTSFPRGLQCVLRLAREVLRLAQRVLRLVHGVLRLKQQRLRSRD
jgi:hypothetical protein